MEAGEALVVWLAWIHFAAPSQDVPPRIRVELMQISGLVQQQPFPAPDLHTHAKHDIKIRLILSVKVLKAVGHFHRIKFQATYDRKTSIAEAILSSRHQHTQIPAHLCQKGGVAIIVQGAHAALV